MLFYLHRLGIQSTVKEKCKQIGRKLRQNNATARMGDLYTQMENVNERNTDKKKKMKNNNPTPRVVLTQEAK